jgi:hypothetical protein
MRIKVSMGDTSVPGIPEVFWLLILIPRSIWTPSIRAKRL